MPYKDQNKLKEYQKEYRKSYQNKNKEKLAAYHKQYSEKNKDQLTDYRKRYYLENKEKELTQNKIWVENNKIKREEYLKMYRSDNRIALRQKFRERWAADEDLRITKSVQQRQRRQERAEWLQELKSNLVCERCGESDPCCLDFHHRGDLVKKDAISKMISHASIEKIIEEIEKCDVLCSNCHRKFHKECSN